MDRANANRDGVVRRYKLDALFKSMCNGIEVAFLVDLTGSMSPHIKAVAKQVGVIVDEFSQRFSTNGGKIVKLAFVGYRDYEDSPNVEFMDFTTDIQRFKSFVNGLRPCGGADAPEDIFSGLAKLAELSWGFEPTKPKLVFHLADCPCHGTIYTGGLDDSYPGGDRDGRKIPDLLSKLRTKCGVKVYHFSHITRHTKTMLQRFKAECGAKDWLYEDEIGNELNKLSLGVIKAAVTATVSTFGKSIAISARESIASPRPFTLSKTPLAAISWAGIPAMQGSLFRCQTPDSVPALVQLIDSKQPLTRLAESTLYCLQMQRQPFSDDGAVRLAYYCRGGKVAALLSSQATAVGKLFRDSSASANTESKYMQQMEVQSAASCMAATFNRVCALGTGLPKISYLTAATWVPNAAFSGSSSCCNIEQLIEAGEIVKFNNNSGYVNPSTAEYADALHAFSHWTWAESKERLIVVDVQGLWDKRKKEFTLMDPAIHCPSDPSRFTDTNLLDHGVNAFFLSHRCNAVCKQLGLKRHNKQTDFEGVMLKARAAMAAP